MIRSLALTEVSRFSKARSPCFMRDDNFRMICIACSKPRFNWFSFIRCVVKKRETSIALITVFIVSLFSHAVYAVDLFTYDGPQASQNERDKTFTAKLNLAAIERESVVVNLPHKLINAKRRHVVGDKSDQVTAYAFENQYGSLVINSKNDVIDNLIIYDSEAEEVFKGRPQSDGEILLEQVNIDTYICNRFAKDGASGLITRETSDISYYKNLTDLTLSQVSSLQSRPGFAKVLYIDYFAGSVSGTAWNISYGDPLVYDNYTYDSDPSTFSLIDLQSMYAGWAETAEDYASFGVNVTTDLSVYNAAAHINKSKIVATSTNWRGSGGVAYVGVFGERTDDYYTIGWTFNWSFGAMGMTNAHEIGHQMGLSHDGTSSLAYYSGHGNWGPIMGAPFYKDFVQWSKGEYPDANLGQNDVSIIQARLGTVADDHGDTNSTSSLLNASEIVGFISPAGIFADIDVFNFTLATNKTVDLTVRSLFQQYNSNGGDNTAGGLNLSAKIELRNSANNLVHQQLPSSIASNNDFIYSGSLVADTYYLTIQNQSYDSNLSSGFNEYGNGGYYSVSLNFLSKEDVICVPIKAANGKLVFVCI